MYRVQIIDPKINLNINVSYENLAKQKRPEVEAKTNTGAIVHEHTIYENKVLPLGSTKRQWVDEAGNVYQKNELTFFYNNEQVQENTQTKVFNITSYQPIKNYTDNYIIGAYYELSPSTNDMKKDIDREMARIVNLSGMRKLWEYLDVNQLVARGEMNVASKGFLASDGYLRAVSFGNHWGLELGIFKEAKIFEHLNESIPQLPQEQTTRLKMV